MKPRSVVAIGVFDGVHLGHQALLDQARGAASREGALTAVVTFAPPPAAVLAPGPEAFQITPLPEKTALLAELGADRLLVLEFTRALAATAPRDFVAGVLLAEFDLAGLVLGHDFRFGADRAGDEALLHKMGKEGGFWVSEVGAVLSGGERVSSTRIRKAIRSGRVAEAARLMGRPLTIEGTVLRGRGLGKRLLVPTANLEAAPEQILPALGVYVVEACLEGKGYPAVANVGPAPTMGTGHDRLVEVHLLDFRGDLRDRVLRVRFLDWLREERHFHSVDALREAIGNDVRTARERLRNGADKQVAP